MPPMNSCKQHQSCCCLLPRTRRDVPRMQGVSTPSTMIGSPARPIQIRLDVDLELGAKTSEKAASSVEEFANHLTHFYNSQIPAPRITFRPGLQSDLQSVRGRWCLTRDGYRSVPQLESGTDTTFGLTLISPIFTFQGSNWRQEVEVVWRWLHQNYNISERNYRSTQIKFILDQVLSCTELQQITQAIVHMEPAFEVLTGVGRRSNKFARSNWMDNRYLAHQGRSRVDSILHLERQTSIQNILMSMHARAGRSFAWQFESMLGPQSIFIFRKPPAVTTAEDVLAWAELAVSFLQAAVACPSSDLLQRVPATIGGLSWFTTRSFRASPGTNEPKRLLRLFNSHKRGAMAEPSPVLDEYEEPEKSRVGYLLQNLIIEDRASIQKRAKAKEPYFRPY